MRLPSTFILSINLFFILSLYRATLSPVIPIRYATAADDADDVPEEQRCIWPGCTRRRAAGRASGSGRQREYCETADRPQASGGSGASGAHEHNARNRWAIRNQELRDTGLGDTGLRESRQAGLDEPRQGPGPRREAAEDGAGAGAVRDPIPLTHAKLHASELLDQARRQHAGALAALAAEREAYERLGEQLRVLADPAALDLEIAAVTLKAGREIAQSAEDAARARQAQLTAHQRRDEAIAGRQDAKRVLAERTAELEQERDVLVREALAAALRADRAQEEAAEARDAAEESRQASEQASRDAELAKAEAARQVTEASARADAAAVRADGAVRAAQERADAERERADADAERATRHVAAAQAEAQAARRDAAEARAEASELRSRLTAASPQRVPRPRRHACARQTRRPGRTRTSPGWRQSAASCGRMLNGSARTGTET
jgi:hypothetical protein